MKKRSLNQWFRWLHKWAGLVAALWLIVLGGTGFVLDHPEWRATSQATVPESWGSPDLTRFIRVTYMRKILVDSNDSSRWLGGSERGLWSSDDGGSSWQPVTFEGIDYSPQILALTPHPVEGHAGALVGTDEGIWQISPRGTAEYFALEEHSVNSLTPGAGTSEVLGVSRKSQVFVFDTATGQVDWADMQPVEPVISGPVTLNRYILNTHFGHGLAEGKYGVLINDYGGIAMVILGTSGFLFWFTRRRWRRSPSLSTPQRKKRITAWLFRSHAPIIGILAIVPIFYVSVTGIFGDHIRAIYKWSESITVPAVLVPAGFSMRSLADDIQDIVLNPADPDELIIATRKGLYTSRDNGRHWQRDDRLPIQKADYGNSLNLFRVGDAIFLGAGLDASYASQDGGETWVPVSGPFTGISSGAYSDGTWYLKNSQGVFAGASPYETQQTQVKPPPLEGMPVFLFLADIHTGHAIAPWFPWVNDFFAVLALVLIVSGPIIWWRRKWM
ncbi:MAG: PepSY domain-containing protein [Gammaproteobacteria bacterium]|nr:PepSY domain-containing protein [Gammaproteobacteria bacterium]